MTGACAGYYRSKFFLTATAVPCESNSHKRRGVCIPDMEKKLQTSCKDGFMQNRKDANAEHQAIKRNESSA